MRFSARVVCTILFLARPSCIYDASRAIFHNTGYANGPSRAKSGFLPCGMVLCMYNSERIFHKIYYANPNNALAELYLQHNKAPHN